jgi:flagellin-like protein
LEFTRRKAVSPIIATLLLIAIAVAAGIVVYVYVNSLAGGLTQGGGQQTTERVQMQSFNFQLSPGACTADQILQIFFLNSGSASVSISSIYFDGTLLTAASPTGSSQSLTNQNYFLVPTTTYVSTCADSSHLTFSSAASLAEPVTSGGAGEAVLVFSTGGAPGTGTSHTVKIVSATGGTYVYSVTAGRTG